MPLMQLTMTKRGANFDPSKSVDSSGLKITFPTAIQNGGEDSLQKPTLKGAGSEAMEAIANHPGKGIGKMFIINRFEGVGRGSEIETESKARV